MFRTPRSASWEVVWSCVSVVKCREAAGVTVDGSLIVDGAPPLSRAVSLSQIMPPRPGGCGGLCRSRGLSMSSDDVEACPWSDSGNYGVSLAVCDGSDGEVAPGVAGGGLGECG